MGGAVWGWRMTFAGAVAKSASLAAQTRVLLQSVGRVHLPGFLTEGAARAILDVLQKLDWKLALNGTSNTYDFKVDDIAALDIAGRKKMLSVVHAQARHGFQFLFDTYRISDECESGALKEGPLAELFAAMNSESVLDGLRTLTGDNRIAYLDAQATRYRPGHFLTRHDDDVEGKNRLFAYVLNLTPTWRIDWGGLLMFHAADGHVSEAYTPQWGALNVFKVAQAHSVSLVTPFADGTRYSITGWMRSERP